MSSPKKTTVHRTTMPDGQMYDVYIREDGSLCIMHRLDFDSTPDMIVVKPEALGDVAADIAFAANRRA